jgi:release factor glutamine methyltransferase
MTRFGRPAVETPHEMLEEAADPLLREAPGSRSVSLAAEPEERVHDFEGLRIGYDDRLLAPRDWTAAQSRWAAELIAAGPPGPVLELCAGAGHIGLLAVTLAPRPLVCVDADPVACHYLRRNAEAAGVRVDVREGPMQSALRPHERFGVVVADPPWVPRTDVSRFPEDPVTAIDGGPDGLDVVRACLTVIAGHLAPVGSAVLQVGPQQATPAARLVAAYDALAVVEVRTFERGALLRIDRAP